MTQLVAQNKLHIKPGSVGCNAVTQMKTYSEQSQRRNRVRVVDRHLSHTSKSTTGTMRPNTNETHTHTHTIFQNSSHIPVQSIFSIANDVHR